jgi:hypothetical protein
MEHQRNIIIYEISVEYYGTTAEYYQTWNIIELYYGISVEYSHLWNSSGNMMVRQLNIMEYQRSE